MPLTFPAGITNDTATLAQWLVALQGCIPQEYVASLVHFRRRFPGLGPISPSVQGLGVSGSPQSGVSRSEWLGLIRQGLAFSSGVLIGAVAGQSGFLQLFNPAASGVQILVYQVTIASSVAGDILAQANNGAQVGTAATPRNKLLSGGTAAGLATIETTGTQAAIIGGQQVMRLPVAASVPFVKNSPLGFLWEVDPGGDLAFQAVPQNANFWVDIDFAVVSAAYL